MIDQQLAKKRILNNVFVLAILAAALGFFKYSRYALMAFSGRQEVADLGPEILQPSVISIIYVCIGISFSTLMASFIAPQLDKQAFGGWSRFGLMFILVFFGYCALAAALL